MSEEKEFRAMRASGSSCRRMSVKQYLLKRGHIYFHSALEGHKIDAVRSSPEACFTVIDEPVKEENDWWFHVRSVICFGNSVRSTFPKDTTSISGLNILLARRSRRTEHKI